MTRRKTSVTIDPVKVEQVRRLAGASSTSAAIDFALTETIAMARIRRDVEAYLGQPPTEDEVALARVSRNWSDLADDTDWAGLYKEARR